MGAVNKILLTCICLDRWLKNKGTSNWILKKQLWQARFGSKFN